MIYPHLLGSELFRSRSSRAALILTLGLFTLSSCGNLAQKPTVNVINAGKTRVLGTAEFTFGQNFAQGKNQF